MIATRQFQPIAVQVHIICEGFERFPDCRLLSDEKRERSDVGQAAPLCELQSEVEPSGPDRGILQ